MFIFITIINFSSFFNIKIPSPKKIANSQKCTCIHFFVNTFMVQTSGTHTDFLHPDNQTTTHAHILLHVIVHNFLFHNHRTGLTFGLTQTVGGICLCPITTAWTVTHPRSVPAIHDDEQNWPAFPTLQGLRWSACSSCQTHGYKGLYNFQKITSPPSINQT